MNADQSLDLIQTIIRLQRDMAILTERMEFLQNRMVLIEHQVLRLAKMVEES